MQFRKDINGLRAVAVIAVVLFHFNNAWVPGGFAGVDVFFVISGFLMTGIIFRGLEQSHFSISKFYISRANRIIPALAVLCLAILVFGWLYINPFDYKDLGKHVASSIGFVSNIIYWKETGYFDAGAHEKWLLHTWSLSVEWQFYIIYPLILVAMRKFMSINAMKLFIVFGAIFGFMFSIVATYQSPNASYYLLHTRAWEMMIGGVAYLYPFKLREANKKLLEWSGLALIIGSYILISKEDLWPGYLAIFPVLGAFFIIQAQRNNGLIANSIIFQKLGSSSYSLYLWHWPIVVAIYYFALNELYVYVGIVLSVLLGFISYRYIEQHKFKNNFSSFSGYLKCKPLLIFLFVAVAGGLVSKNDGFEEHYSDAIVLAASEVKNGNWHCSGKYNRPCFIGNKHNIRAIVVGDSHAQSLATALVGDENRDGVIFLKGSKIGCPFFLNLKRIVAENSCIKSNVKRMEYLNKNYPGVPVFWIARTGFYLYGHSNPEKIDDITDVQPLVYFTKQYEKASKPLYNELKENLSITIKQILKNHPVFIVQPVPEMRITVPKVMARNLILNNKDKDLSLGLPLYFERNKHVIKITNEISEIHNIQVLDPVPFLCGSGRCIAQLKGRPLYLDGNHLSEYGNKLLVPMFRAVLEPQKGRLP